MNDWRDEDPPRPNRLSAGMCPCDDCTGDGAVTTDLDPEEFQ